MNGGGRLVLPALLLALVGMLGGCATRPVNPAITQVDRDKGYHYLVHEQRLGEKRTF